MEDFVYYGELFNIYGLLLNESNRKYYKLYYEENFTLQEIADLEKVSKLTGISIDEINQLKNNII